MNETDKLLNDKNKDNKDNKNIDIYVDIDLQSSTINSIDKYTKNEERKTLNQSLCNCCKILEPQEKIICGALISSIIITVLLIFL